MSNAEGFFRGVEQAPVATTAGPCDLPILYRDASLLGLFYRIDPAVAARVLPADVPVEPLVVLGKATVLFVAFDYRETTVGSYREIGLAVMVRRPGAKISTLRLLRDITRQEDQALWVVNLPVTTEAARAAGVDIWGYPKYVTGIEADIHEDRARVRLEGELELTVGRGPGLRMAGLPFVTFTVDGGNRMLRTIVKVGHKVRYGGARTVQLDKLGDGPTARSLEALELFGRRADYAFRTTAMRAILPAGEVVGVLTPAVAETRSAA